MVRSMGSAGCEIDEERLVRGQRLLLSDPFHSLIRHVIDKVVAFFGGPLVFTRRRTLVERRVPLVGLAADEAVEVFEAAATGRPSVERPVRTCLPDRHFVALAEMRGRVAVELKRSRQRGHRIREYRAVARRRSSNFGDAAHAGGVVVAPSQHRLSCGRAERCRVEPIELQAVGRQFLRVRRLARSTKSTGRTKASVVDENQQHIGRPCRGPQVPDGWELRFRVLSVIGCQTEWLHIWDGENGALNLVVVTHERLPSFRNLECRRDDEEKEVVPIFDSITTLEASHQRGNCKNVQSCWLRVTWFAGGMLPRRGARSELVEVWLSACQD